MKTELVGFEELLKYCDNLKKLPQKVVTKSAKAGAKISLQSAKANAPFLTGDLQSGIVLKAEKTKVKGKKVYQTTFNSAMNNVFQKKSKNGKISYYPSSQEYGFKTKSGRVEGLHYMKESLTENASNIEKTIVDSVISEIDKIK